MDALGQALYPEPARSLPAIVTGYAPEAAEGTTAVNVLGETFDAQPIAGQLAQVGSEQDVLCVRVGRQLTVLEGSGFYSAR